MLRLAKFLKPYRLTIAVVLLLVLLQTLSDLYLPTLMSNVVNKGVLTGDTPYIWKMGGLMLAVSVAGSIFAILASLYAAKVSSKFAQVLRRKVFAHIEGFSLQEFNHVGTASLITRTTNDISQVQNLVLMILRMMVMAPLMCVGGIVMAVSKDKELSSIFILVLPILALTIFLIMRKSIPYFRQLQVKLDKINLVLRESLIGVRVIRAFNRTRYEQDRFEEANKGLMDVAVRVNQLMALSMPLMMLIMNLSIVLIIWFGSQRIDMNEMNIGDLMAFIQYGMQIMFSLLMMSMMLIMVPRAQASAVRIQEVLDTEPTVHNTPARSMTAKEAKGNLVFNHVSYTYPGAEEAAVEDLSFTCEPGKTTAIIGGTGSGKSTIIHLVERFFDVTKGSITLDGVDIRDWNLAEYRKTMSIVPQKVVLFSGTVAENIRYGADTASDLEVKSAAQIAQASSFIEKLEGGYDAEVSQGGLNLSGGQKQRLSIARAIVRRPKLYLFDDSFSALDYKTDALLRAALKEQIKDATVIIVAQRVSTVMDADQILVMDNGKIVDKGTHQELLEHSEVYREIVQSQLSEEESA